MSTVLQAKLNQKKKEEEESAADWVIDQIVKHRIATPSCLCVFFLGFISIKTKCEKDMFVTCVK